MFIGKGEPATVILRAWNAAAGPDWETAASSPTCILGESNPVTITLGGRHLELPATLIGLQPFELTLVPEPATVALLLLGLGTLTTQRRSRPAYSRTPAGHTDVPQHVLRVVVGPRQGPLPQ
ncbi:MAG: hypothetical protein RI897_507 [Verrucomicrobiota bacterium]